MRRLLTTLSFIEEILPFTDIVPSATIGWFMEYTRAGRKAEGENPSRAAHPWCFKSSGLSVLTALCVAAEAEQAQK